MAASVAVATAGDVILYDRDARLFEPGRWLSDQCIAYAFEILGETAPKSTLRLEPATIFMACMLNDAETLRGILSQPRTAGASSLAERLSSQTTKLIYLPINDKEDPEAHDGGGHWSLLVFRRGSSEGSPSRFEHYDSCEPANAQRARAAAEALAPLLGDGAQLAKLVSVDTPQQANGFDCGVYVLAIAELLCGASADSSAAAVEAALAAVRELTPADVTAKRREWLARLFP